MLGGYCNLLVNAATSEGPVGDVDYLTEGERELVLHVFNDTARGFAPRTIVEWFEDVAKNRKDAVAVVCEDESITYDELNRRANCVARKLRELGVSPDDFVAMLTQKSTQMIVDILGILKAGGAYVPLDPTYPEDRKE